jgi:hypothetical protein
MADTAGVRSAAQRAFAAAADIPAADRGLVYDQIRSVLYNVMGTADVMKDSAMAEQAMVRLRDLLESLVAPNSRTADSVQRYLSPQLPVLRGMLTVGYDRALGRIGQMPPVSAEHWFSEQGTSMAPPDSTKPMLVLRVTPHRCNGIRCEKAYAALDRLAKQYQPRGVQIVLLVSTAGYLHSAVFDSVATEVRAIRAYVQDTLKLPGILAVSESEFVQRQDRRIQQVVRGNEAYAANWFVVRDGMGGNRSRALGFLSDQPDSEAWVRLVLDRILAGS